MGKAQKQEKKLAAKRQAVEAKKAEVRKALASMADNTTYQFYTGLNKAYDGMILTGAQWRLLCKV